VDLEVKAYLLSTRYEDFMEARQAVMLEMYDIVARNGAEMAYPTMRILQ
jgi:small-conductance mechanosensitive channel